MDRDEIKLNNAKSHLTALRGEIIVESANLAEVIRKKQEEEEKLSSLLEKVSQTNDELQEAKERIELYGSHYRQTVQDLKERQERFDEEEGKFQADKKAADAAVGTAKSQVNKLHEEKKEAEEEILKARENISQLNADASEIEEKIRELSVESLRIARENEEAIQEGNETVVGLDKMIDERKNELKDLQTKVAAETKKIELPLQSLIAREQAVMRREKNFEIMYHRMNKVFQAMYPGQKLKI